MHYVHQTSQRFCAIGILMASIFILGACDTAPSMHPEPTEPDGSDVVQFLVEQGFDANDIVEKGSSLIVEGDIVMDKASIRRFMNRSEAREKAAGDAKQAVDPNFGIIDRSNVDNITVKLHSSLPSDWANAFRNAISEWSTANRSLVDLTEVSSGTADITVYSDESTAINNSSLRYLPYSVLGAALFPGMGTTAAGEAGEEISINVDYNLGNGSGGSPTAGSKNFVATHELGHALGLRHTNWDGLGEQPAGSRIDCTPSTDANSVMNGGDPEEEGGNLSLNDEDAIAIIYPYSLSDPTPRVYAEETGLGGFATLFEGTYQPNTVELKLYRKKNSGSWQLHRTGCGSAVWQDVVRTDGATYYYKAKATYYGGYTTGFGSVRSITLPSGWGGL